jgi:hypothetical protein
MGTEKRHSAGGTGLKGILVLLLIIVLGSCSGGGGSDSGGGYSSADYRFLNEHNAQYLDGHTIRWESNTIYVYTNGLPGAQEAINRWSGPMSFVFVNYRPSVGISFDWTGSSSYCGVTYTDYYTSGKIAKATIYIATDQTRCRGGLDNTLTHESAHALGFFTHTSDGGLMDPDGGNGNITTTMRNFFSLLYSHPYGWDITNYLSPQRKVLINNYRPNGTEIRTRIDY